jgi:hypothetical protein
MVGLPTVFQHTPLALIVPPPSSVILPPDDTVVSVSALIAVVVNVDNIAIKMIYALFTRVYIKNTFCIFIFMYFK